MKEFLQYNLEAGAILIVLSAFYFLMLKNQKYFALNRTFLVLSFAFAFAIPLVNISQPSATPVSLPNITQPFSNAITVSPAGQASSFSIWDFLGVAYISGIITAFLLVFKNIIQLTSRIKKYDFEKKDGCLIAFDDSSGESFTFFNRIVIGTRSHNENEINMMLEHEKTHVKKMHSLDILLIEAAKVIQWFNPAIYFYKKAILQNHEFSADLSVNKHSNRKEYINLVTKNVIGAPLLPVNSFFNKSILKRRLNMLTNTKKRKTGILGYFLILPVLAMIFISVSCSESEIENLDIPGYADFGGERTENNHPAQFDGEFYYYANKHIEIPKEAKDAGVSAKLHYRIVIGKDGSLKKYEFTNAKFADDDHDKYLDELKTSAVKLLKNMPKWEPAVKDGKPVEMKMFKGIVVGDMNRWKRLNSPDMVGTGDKGRAITAEKTKSDDEIKYLFYHDLMMHIVDNVKYPDKMHEENLAGRVILDLSISKEGKITKIKPLASVFTKNGEDLKIEDTYGMTDEAVRVVRSCDNLPPAEDSKGNPVAVDFKLPIKFKLKEEEMLKTE